MNVTQPSEQITFKAALIVTVTNSGVNVTILQLLRDDTIRRTSENHVLFGRNFVRGLRL